MIKKFFSLRWRLLPKNRCIFPKLESPFFLEKYCFFPHKYHRQFQVAKRLCKTLLKIYSGYRNIARFLCQRFKIFFTNCSRYYHKFCHIFSVKFVSTSHKISLKFFQNVSYAFSNYLSKICLKDVLKNFLIVFSAIFA